MDYPLKFANYVIFNYILSVNYVFTFLVSIIVTIGVAVVFSVATDLLNLSRQKQVTVDIKQKGCRFVVIIEIIIVDNIVILAVTYSQ
jgi:hypothetical protein